MSNVFRALLDLSIDGQRLVLVTRGDNNTTRTTCGVIGHQARREEYARGGKGLADRDRMGQDSGKSSKDARNYAATT